MVGFHDVLFEVSNEDRYEILSLLSESMKMVSKVAEILEISMTEASRNFNRLTSAGLIQKRADGYYMLTPLGFLTLRSLETLRFTLSHRDYFLDRNLLGLPNQFVSRLNELESGTQNYRNKANIMNTGRTIMKVFSEAERHMHYILDDEIAELILYAKPEAGSIERFQTQIKNGVHLRFIFPETFDMNKVNPEMLELNQRLSATGLWESRLIDECDVFLNMSEKEVAVLSFPNIDGYVDYLGFEGKDASMLCWCNDVFDYYWKQSRPVKLY